MARPIPLRPSSIHDCACAEEWEQRVALAARYRLVPRSGAGYGLLAWPALLRALNRADPSYRD